MPMRRLADVHTQVSEPLLELKVRRICDNNLKELTTTVNLGGTVVHYQHPNSTSKLFH